jgi:hypothetical protein
MSEQRKPSALEMVWNAMGLVADRLIKLEREVKELREQAKRNSKKSS